MQSINDFLGNYQLSWSNTLLALLGALFLGLGKSGVKGIGVIIVTIMALVFGGKSSTGVLIPMMIVADVFAVVYYHRHTQWRLLRNLLPAMIVGVLIGVWIGNDISDHLFKQIMAVFILMTVLVMIWMDHKKNKNISHHWIFSSGMGLVSGVTSMIGNLAGSFVNIYFLAMRLPKNEFIGTAAWLFFIINVFKLPFHVFVWKTVTSESLVVNLFLLPGILIGFFAGVKLVKLVNNDFYRKFIMAVMVIGALLILIS